MVDIQTAWVPMHQRMYSSIVFRPVNSMTIEEFRQVYLRLCKDHHVEAQDNVLDALAKYAGPIH